MWPHPCGLVVINRCCCSEGRDTFTQKSNENGAPCLHGGIFPFVVMSTGPKGHHTCQSTFHMSPDRRVQFCEPGMASQVCSILRPDCSSKRCFEPRWLWVVSITMVRCHLSPLVVPPHHYVSSCLSSECGCGVLKSLPPDQFFSEPKMLIWVYLLTKEDKPICLWIDALE